jgi:ribonuclease G
VWRLLCDRHEGLLRCALIDTAGTLTMLTAQPLDEPAWAGAVVRGKVVRLLPGLNAALIDIGDKRNGAALLQARDIRPLQQGVPITRCLRAGEMVTAQIKAEGQGGKGATLSMDISLPGRFVVFLPHGEGVRTSKRWPSNDARCQAMRARLREAAPRLGGWLLRVSARTAQDPDSLLMETERMAASWQALAAEIDRDPHRIGVIMEGPGAMERILLEEPITPGALAAWTLSDADLLSRARALAQTLAPDLAALPRLHPSAQPLFDHADLDGQWLALIDRKVPLPGGGWLAFDRTEAMMVVDVNSGDQGGQPLVVNLAACREIARQIRLRNLGGVIIVDFISMRRPADQEALIAAMTGAVADDPAGVEVHGLSKLGLMELTRTRRGPSLSDLANYRTNKSPAR